LGFRVELPDITAKNGIVLGISPDTPADLRKWQQKKELPFDLFSDPDHKILEQWGAWGEKTIAGHTVTGVIRSHWVIDEEGVVIDEQLNITPLDSVRKSVAALD
jgi:thioredoxin-dependent peroxiredoxin